MARLTLESDGATHVSTNKHVMRVFWLIVVGTMVLTTVLGHWPEIFGFAVKSNSGPLLTAVEAPLHLTDDVMISLRTGNIFNETGVPAFNRTDLAQPSTSYVSPYLFAFLAKIFPDHVAVAAYAFLALFSVGLTFGFLYLFAKSKSNAVILILALLLTETNLYFALNGWDHLFQALFMTLAACIGLQKETNKRGLIIAGIALVFGSLFRPDGLLIALAILWALYLSTQKPKQFFLYALIPFVVLFAAALALNYYQFGYFTPTTARLKIGSAPTLGYAIKQFMVTGFATYSALTVMIVLVFFYFIFIKKLGTRKNLPVVIACLITGCVDFYNSDFFPAARMYWLPACVMAAVTAVSAPRFLASGSKDRKVFSALSPVYSDATLTLKSPRKINLLSKIFIPGVIVFTSICLISALVYRLKTSVIIAAETEVSPFAQQYIIVSWINDNLKPSDGALGFFYLGMSYHAPRFEIADFLGKADEAIANTPKKWGIPGHNKWDYDKSFEKWNLQAIIPGGNSDPQALHAKQIFSSFASNDGQLSYGQELMSYGKVVSDFSYCYVVDPEVRLIDKWGFFLRNDIVAQHRGQLNCH